MTLLSEAVRICKEYGISKKEAEVYRELCKVVLPYHPDYALTVANDAISADPNNDEVSYM